MNKNIEFLIKVSQVVEEEHGDFSQQPYVSEINEFIIGLPSFLFSDLTTIISALPQIFWGRYINV